MLAHLRTEAYPVYSTPQYPPVRRTAAHAAGLSYDGNNVLIEEAKRRVMRTGQEPKLELTTARANVVSEPHERSGDRRGPRERVRRGVWRGEAPQENE